MLAYFFAIFLLYGAFTLAMIIGWSRSKIQLASPIAESSHKITVAIVVRNERENIVRLLESLEQQSMSKNDFEVIIVDDASTDDTGELIKEYQQESDLDLRLVDNEKVEKDQSPKKTAINKVVNLAKGDIIAVTDGDCIVDPHWLASLLRQFGNQSVQFISAPVALVADKSVLSKMQQLEFASLIGTGGAMTNLNYPLISNAANMAFRRSAFLEVNGFDGVDDIASGDDVFLMQKIHRLGKGAVVFLQDQNALVLTQGTNGFNSFVRQRRRWATKWKSYLLPLSWALPPFLFVFYISMLAGAGLMIFNIDHYWPIASLFGLKIFLDLVFLKKVMKFCKLPLHGGTFLLTELAYPFYVIFFGLLVHFGRYEWKGRSYKA